MSNKARSSPKRETKDAKKPAPGKKVEYKKKLAIPEDKLSEYKESFDYFDRDKSGEITIQELRGLLQALGQKTTEGRLKEMIDELDQDGDGTITFDEYVTIMEKNEVDDDEPLKEEDDGEEEIIKAFKVFDVQKKGYLNAVEFKHILKNLGDEENRFNDAEVEQVFKEADLNNDGKINYYEFVEFWKQK